MSRGYLRAGFLNANSLKTHIYEIRQFLKDDPSCHLFGIAESISTLNTIPKINDYLVQIDGYTFVQQDRKVGGGGVALYVRNSLKVKNTRKI